MEKKAPVPVALTFAAWLQARLNERNWSQREAAERLGTSHSTVSRWLKGRKPEASYIDRIADVFVTDYDYVATIAGIRPRELIDEGDLGMDKARLMGKLQRLALDKRRVRTLELIFDGYLEDDQQDSEGGDNASLLYPDA